MTRVWLMIVALGLAGTVALSGPGTAEPMRVAQTGITPAPTPEPTKPPHTRPESGKEPLGDPSEAHPAPR